MFKDHEYHDKALEEWRNVNIAYLPLISVTEIAYFLKKHKIDLSVIQEIIEDPKSISCLMKLMISIMHYLIKIK